MANNSINDKMFWIGYCLWMCFYVSVLLSSKQNIIQLLKHRCVEFISIKLPTMEKSNKKKRKTEKHTIILVFEKWNSTSRTGTGGCNKKEVISNSKTTALTYFDMLKKKQQDQGSKYFYLSFISQLWPNNYSTISNLHKTT